jgi:hypothetical protein
MKSWSIVCIVFVAALFIAPLTPSQVQAQSGPYGYHCSIYPPTFDSRYWASNGDVAVSTCQGYVNQQAISYCSGQGNTGPWQMNYSVGYMPNWPNDIWPEDIFFQDSIWWQCVDGWPVYA